ncbi:virulence factor TspB C-terminal domain-related protein [Acinetobacter sp. YH1901136]|uniref:virulence factor TspB C-terminal domain-related protein n=1 Tax=Acinetobacter sp. YH1901136 TaxID=2601200 RepID=UPI0015D40106|nr:virulence factor TspB C-terminal domain-related protein [Acinetobacter sp. YH1901136]
MIHRLNVFLLSLIIAFAPVYLISTAYAATPKWVLDYIKAEKQINEKKRLKAHLIKQVNDAGTKKTINAVVETVPTASKVGSAMIKRIHSPAGVVGVAAVTSLLNGIGWVMEDGTYVKRVEKEASHDDPQYQYYYSITPEQTPFNAPTAAAVYEMYVKWWNNGNYNGWGPITGLRGSQVQANGSVIFDPIYKSYPNWVAKITIRRIANPNYDPDKPPQDKVVPLTAALLGAAMLGEGYKDPDPNFDNDTVNTGDWNGVEDAYKEDPSGIGNELNDSLEDKAERAKPTPDNKPAPIGSPDYDNEPVNDDDNDRKWDEDGNEGKTDSTEKTDPETGDKTTEGSFTLPKFCDWAFTVCEWYEDWQESDKKLHDHLDETAQHQSDEKSFWDSVLSWFDWTKQEPEQPPVEPYEIQNEDDSQLLDQMQSVSFNSASYCPADVEIPVNFSGLGSTSLTLSYAPLCQIATQIKPVVIMMGWILSAYIVTGRYMKDGS